VSSTIVPVFLDEEAGGDQAFPFRSAQRFFIAMDSFFLAAADIAWLQL
jgi:hypothetical protein